MLTSTFFLKKKKEKIFLRIRLDIQKNKHTYKNLDYMVNGNVETIFGLFLTTKSLQQRF